jgi:AcrR family transcriptional regulator
MKPINREAHRAKLIEAAIAIVARDGLGGLTFRAVADEVGTTTAPFVYAFGSKAGLLDAVAQSAWEAVWGPVDTPIRRLPAGADALVALRLNYERAIPLQDPIPNDLIAYAEIFFQNLRDPSLAAIIERSTGWSHHGYKVADALIRAAQRHGSIDPGYRPREISSPLARFAGGLLVESLYYSNHLPRDRIRPLWEEGFRALTECVPDRTSQPRGRRPTRPSGPPRTSATKAVDEHREELIDAVVRVIARDGLGGLTFRSAARELGTTTAPFTYAFGSKAAMLEAVGRRVFFQVWGSVYDTPRPEIDEDPLGTLRTVYERSLPLTRPVPEYLRAYTELFFQNLRNAELALVQSASVEWSIGINRRTARIVRRAQRLGLIDPRRRAYDLILEIDSLAGGFGIVGLHYPEAFPVARLRKDWDACFRALTEWRAPGRR